MLLKLLFMGKNLLEELGIGGHLGYGIQEWDVDLELFEHLKEFFKLGLKLSLVRCWGKGIGGR